MGFIENEKGIECGEGGVHGPLDRASTGCGGVARPSAGTRLRGLIPGVPGWIRGPAGRVAPDAYR